MKFRAGFVALVLVGSGCVLGHARKDIPPPGGCDQCHRGRISSDWEVGVAPPMLGRDGGVPDGTDLRLREVRELPIHREVPAKRLEVFAAAAPPEAIGDRERGIQCFVCHRSPGPPHEDTRGNFHHPWGGGAAKQP